MALTTVRSTGIGSLPAISGANLTSLTAGNLTGTLPAINGANLTGISSGLSEVDMWRLVADFTQDAQPITQSFERCDTDNHEKIGTGLSFSSGVWTFAVTGLYKITFNSQHRRNGENPSLEQVIQISTDGGSNWSTTAKGYPTLQEYTSTVYSSGSCHCLLNVTGTASNFKVRLFISNASDAYTNGSTSQNRTYILFERLGDAQ